MIQAEALCRTVDTLLKTEQRLPAALHLPPQCQGYIYGQKGALREWWNRAGLPPHNIYFDAPVQEGQGNQKNRGWLEWELANEE
jgi:hypothetical protein